MAPKIKKLIIMILSTTLIGCAVKIKENRFNTELQRYEIKLGSKYDNWIVLRNKENKIVRDSTLLKVQLDEASKLKNQAQLNQRFIIENRIQRNDNKYGKYFYYEGIELYKNGLFEDAKIKFKEAIFRDSLLVYKSDIFLWLSIVAFKINNIDSSDSYYKSYVEFSESNVFPEFNHEMKDNHEYLRYLQNSKANHDSILSLKNYHTNIYEKPSFEHRQFYIGSNRWPSEKGLLFAGASYNKVDKLAGILGIEFKPIYLFTPVTILQHGSNITHVTLGTYIKHLNSKYNDFSSRFYINASYINRKIDETRFEFWQPMIGYEINYFPIEKIGLYVATYNFYYNQWNKFNTDYSNGVISQWNNNRIVLGTSWFLYKDINITGRLNNITPEILIDFGGAQLGVSENRIFFDINNYLLSNN